MKPTLADYQFARDYAFRSMFPSTAAREREHKAKAVSIVGLDRQDSRAIHEVINSHLYRTQKHAKPRYMHSNTLWIIKSRIRRRESWKAPKDWVDGPGTLEHRVIVARIVRRLERRGVR